MLAHSSLSKFSKVANLGYKCASLLNLKANSILFLPTVLYCASSTIFAITMYLWDELSPYILTQKYMTNKYKNELPPGGGGAHL